MPWTLTDDVELYAEQAWSLLARDPVLHTVPLTVIETLRTGHRWSAEPIVLGWFTADDHSPTVIGAVGRTPPYELLLAEVPDGAMGSLVDALRAAAVPVPAVRGQSSLVADFSARWRAGTSIVEAGGEQQRLYCLAALTPPPGATGRARLATLDDVDLVTEYWDEFQTEAGVHRAEVGPLARARVGAGLVWLWVVDGEVVSMAGRNAIAAGVARVGPVYTPPEHRRHGYAAAVTSACTQSALDCGARDVVLFTDLANPTSNSVYQSIGYRPVTDFHTIEFTSSSESCAPSCWSDERGPGRSARPRPRPSR